MRGCSRCPGLDGIGRRVLRLEPERSPVFAHVHGSAVSGPELEFFAPNGCRDRGDWPRRVPDTRAGAGIGSSLRVPGQEVPGMRSGLFFSCRIRGPSLSGSSAVRSQ